MSTGVTGSMTPATLSDPAASSSNLPPTVHCILTFRERRLISLSDNREREREIFRFPELTEQRKSVRRCPGASQWLPVLFAPRSLFKSWLRSVITLRSLTVFTGRCPKLNAGAAAAVKSQRPDEGLWFLRQHFAPASLPIPSSHIHPQSLCNLWTGRQLSGWGLTLVYTAPSPSTQATVNQTTPARSPPMCLDKRMRISAQQIAIYWAGRGRSEGLSPGRCREWLWLDLSVRQTDRWDWLR